ncbi:hypothetical protein GTW69_22305 [Streptomyces sp. SID7760]|nr:hypothetical protein [Streptomyces sp. SID7760]
MEAADLFPRLPVPPDTCAEWAAHVVDRFQAYVDRDRSRVSDMNVLIMRHHPELRVTAPSLVADTDTTGPRRADAPRGS